MDCNGTILLYLVFQHIQFLFLLTHQYSHQYLQHICHRLNLFFYNEPLQVSKFLPLSAQHFLHNKHIVIYYTLYMFLGHTQFFHIFIKTHTATNCISFHLTTSSNLNLFSPMFKFFCWICLCPMIRL